MDYFDFLAGHGRPAVVGSWESGTMTFKTVSPKKKQNQIKD